MVGLTVPTATFSQLLWRSFEKELDLETEILVTKPVKRRPLTHVWRDPCPYMDMGHEAVFGSADRWNQMSIKPRCNRTRARRAHLSQPYDLLWTLYLLVVFSSGYATSEKNFVFLRSLLLFSFFFWCFPGNTWTFSLNRTCNVFSFTSKKQTFFEVQSPCQINTRTFFCVIFGGDFQQILPVVVKGGREDIVGFCLQRSLLWQKVQQLHLKQNMRLGGPNARQEDRDFEKWLLDVGHGWPYGT